MKCISTIRCELGLSFIHSLTLTLTNCDSIVSDWPVTTPSGIGPPTLAPQQVVTLSDFLVGKGILINHTVFVSLCVIKGGTRTRRVDDEVLRLQMEVIADKCRSKKRKCSEAWETTSFYSKKKKFVTVFVQFCNSFLEQESREHFLTDVNHFQYSYCSTRAYSIKY